MTQVIKASGIDVSRNDRKRAWLPSLPGEAEAAVTRGKRECNSYYVTKAPLLLLLYLCLKVVGGLRKV